jgi:hypothetical protein
MSTNDNQQENAGEDTAHKIDVEAMTKQVTEVAGNILASIPQGTPLHLVWAAVATAHTQMFIQAGLQPQQVEELMLYHGGMVRMTYHQNFIQSMQEASAATKQ